MFLEPIFDWVSTYLSLSEDLIFKNLYTNKKAEMINIGITISNKLLFMKNLSIKK